jgi:hypothetical protein
MFPANPNVQIAPLMCQFHCNLPTMIRKTLSDPQDAILKNKYPSSSLGAAIPLRPAKTELPNTLGLQHSTVDRKHRSDTPTPMHKVAQRMQTTTAQRRQRREKVTWNHQLHCVRSSGQIPW